MICRWKAFRCSPVLIPVQMLTLFSLIEQSQLATNRYFHFIQQISSCFSILSNSDSKVDFTYLVSPWKLPNSGFHFPFRFIIFMIFFKYISWFIILIQRKLCLSVFFYCFPQKLFLDQKRWRYHSHFSK